jgi:hypothetical protein
MTTSSNRSLCAMPGTSILQKVFSSPWSLSSRDQLLLAGRSSAVMLARQPNTCAVHKINTAGHGQHQCERRLRSHTGAPR